MGDDASGEESADESDGQADEEELKEIRRKTKKVQSKPASKKPKTLNGIGKLAIRPAPNGVKKVAKGKKPRARPSAVEDHNGLYGIFIRLLISNHVTNTLHGS